MPGSRTGMLGSSGGSSTSGGGGTSGGMVTGGTSMGIGVAGLEGGMEDIKKANLRYFAKRRNRRLTKTAVARFWSFPLTMLVFATAK